MTVNVSDEVRESKLSSLCKGKGTNFLSNPYNFFTKTAKKQPAGVFLLALAKEK